MAAMADRDCAVGAGDMVVLVSNLRDRRNSPKRRIRGGIHPGWACFLFAWGSGLFTMGAGMATMEWGLGYATGGTAIITGGLAAFLFILGGNKAEGLTDREGK
jgi:hypothetical protein